ncbi:hypothetical protein GOODEAATRI_027492, partial [Goodea atripinnis]
GHFTGPACSSSAFFQRRDDAAGFVIPPSEAYVRELHACWSETFPGQCQMAGPSRFGLGQMPTVEPEVATLSRSAVLLTTRSAESTTRGLEWGDWECPLPSVAGSLVLSGVCVLGPIDSGHVGCVSAVLCLHDEGTWPYALHDGPCLVSGLASTASSY